MHGNEVIEPYQMWAAELDRRCSRDMDNQATSAHCPSTRYRRRVAFPSPEDAALAGDHTSAQTRVLAQAVGEDDAVVILMSPGWPQPDCVLCRRSAEGWVERGTTSGQAIWCSSAEDDSLGFHALWGRAKARAKAVLVTFRGTTVEVPVENDHYVCLVERVPIEAMDEPIDFRWLP